MIDFTKLDPQFNEKLQQLIVNMEALGHKVSCASGWRSLEEQAKLYRRSRSLLEIEKYMNDLATKGAPYVASIIEKVGPQSNGPWATNTVIWSQHLMGWAVDCLIDSKPDGDNIVYKVLNDEAKKLGLITGLNFSTPDPGHIQFSATELDHLKTYPEMDFILKEINEKNSD